MKRTRTPLFSLIALLLCAHAHAAGLLAPTDATLPPLRITKHAVDVTVRDHVALTTISQTFRNDTQRRLEATYVFPLPENADLTDFQMSFNGKMVKGEVVPAEEARRIYESIVRQAQDPGLIEFIGTRLLRMRVFPIEPQSETQIQVKYQQICKPLSNMSAYHYPLRTCKAAGQVYGTVSFNVKLETAAPLKNVWSPTHGVEIVRDGEHKAKIAYEASKGSLDDDFMLLYDTDASELGLSVIAHRPSESKAGHFVLTLTPRQLWPKQEYQPQDVVFVIDTSGSMSGQKIEQARAALKFCVDQLDQRDMFNIVRFSTGVDTVFEHMQPANAENRAMARERISHYRASGGTNITDALQRALDLRPRGQIANGRPFVIVFITDGIGNQPPEHTMSMLKSHPGSDGARIFTFGVGHDVHTVFLDQLAVNYNGKPTYVQPGENLELMLGDFFAIISQPVLTNLRLSLPEINATERFPTTLGDLYHGQQIIIAGKFDKPLTGPVKLTATRDGKDVEFEWKDIAFTHTTDADFVPAIWAGRKIAFLIDQIRLHGENKEMIDEVVALSREFGIQTPYSSWLVNPEQAPMIAGRPVGMGGGAGDAFARNEAQLRRLQSAGVPIDERVHRADVSGLNLVAPATVHEASGAAASRLASENSQMRDNRSRDDGRFNQGALAVQNISNRWYNRIGQFLVDEEFDETSPVLNVRFGSEAYFEIVSRRADLRPVLAQSRNAVVQTAPRQFILITENTGIDRLSEDQLQQTGLAGRR